MLQAGRVEHLEDGVSYSGFRLFNKLQNEERENMGILFLLQMEGGVRFHFLGFLYPPLLWQNNKEIMRATSTQILGESVWEHLT